METFYTPQSPPAEFGHQNYDLILDGSVPNDATLTADHKKRLDSIAAMTKEMIGKKGQEAAKDALVMAGFGDSMDTNPLAASEQRTRAVVNYVLSKGVPKDTINMGSLGATWAAYEVGTKKAQEGRSRRVQVRLF